MPQIEKTRLWLYYKPVGLVTTHKDEQNRETVFNNLPQYMPRVVSVGRLDLNSEGLLLLTNNGGLSRELELPKNAWSRRYRVRVHGRIDNKKHVAVVDITLKINKKDDLDNFINHVQADKNVIEVFRNNN